MKNIKHILLFLTAVGLFSCKKEQDDFPISISGKVIDGSTLLPVQNATIRLYKNAGTYTNNTVSTDASGNYSFNLQSADDYGLEVYSSGYVKSFEHENRPPSSENVRDFNIKIYPLVYLDIKVKLVDPTYAYMAASSFLDQYSFPHVYLQTPIDTVKHLILYKKGGVSNTFVINIDKSDVPYDVTPLFSASYSHTVFCSTADTTFYNIEY